VNRSGDVAARTVVRLKSRIQQAEDEHVFGVTTRVTVQWADRAAAGDGK
jgi:hypothetical protein